MATTRRKSDGCELLDDGQVRIIFGGTVRTLRRPLIGELKRFNNLLMELAKEQAAAKDAGEIDIDDAVAGTLRWWQEVVDTLRGDEDLPSPSDLDDWPTWMMNGELMANIQNHWREVPYLSGGK